MGLGAQPPAAASSLPCAPAGVRQGTFAGICVLVLAVILRVAYVLDAQDSATHRIDSMDQEYHVQWAEAFSRGEIFQKGPFFRAPLYPWFLGVLLGVSDGSRLFARLVQALLGGISAYLTFRIGRACFGSLAGTLAGFLVATNWVLIYFDGEFLIPTLFIPLTLLALAGTLKLKASPSIGLSLVAGIAWGVSFLARPNALLFMPVLFAWLAISAPVVRRARKLLLAAGVLAGVAFAVLPVTAYNWFVGHDAVLISSQAGLNLWIGNNPTDEWDGVTAVVPGTRSDWWGGYRDTIAQAELEEGRDLRPSEVSRFYSRKTTEFLLDDPRLFALRLLRKARLFILNRELTNNLDPDFFARHNSVLLAYLPIGFWLLGPLALVGICLGRSRSSGHFLLWSFLLVYSASVILFFINSRYRAPIIPILALFAGNAASVGIDWLRARSWLRVGLLLACAGGMSLCTLATPPEVFSPEAQGTFVLGTLALEEGDVHGARDYFEKAITSEPRFFPGWRGLAHTLLALGDTAGARRALESALGLRPGDAASRLDLTRLQLLDADVSAAKSNALVLTSTSPGVAKGHYYLGVCHRAAGESAQALLAFQQAVALAPRDFDGRFALATTLADSGRVEEAIAHLVVAVEQTDPPADAVWLQRAHDLLLSLRHQSTSGESYTGVK